MRICVTGSNGQVGTEVVELATAAGHDVVALGSTDVGDRDLMREAIGSARPDAVIHCAAYTDVDGCESDPERARRVNTDGVRFVSEAAEAVGEAVRVVAVSTDYVFDGEKVAPYVESDPTNPLGVYGRTKLAGEQTLDLGRHAVARTSWVCGRVGRNVARTVLRLADEGTVMRFVDDQRGHPTIARDLAGALIRLAEDRATGIWHTTNQGAVSWFEFAREVVRVGGGDPGIVTPITTAELDPPRPARRPANSVLDSERFAPGQLLPDFRASLPDLIAALRAG
ncbi:MAG: dTDP-4-dehydrorhamnose reductase [Actinomycetota bacterium]